MPHFKDRAEIFRHRVDAFYTFFAHEFDEVEGKMLDKEMPVLEKELSLFIFSVKSMRNDLEHELKELKKTAKSIEDHESIIPLKEISSLQTTFIFRYFNGYVKRVNDHIDLFNEKINTLLEYYFTQTIDYKDDWSSIKKVLDSEFPVILNTIYEDYEKVYQLREAFLQDVANANQKYQYNLDLADQITVVDDLKNIVNILRKQRACFIETCKEKEYEKRVHEYQENIIALENKIKNTLAVIARNEKITISEVCSHEKNDYLKEMLNKYCELQEKLKFDEIAIKAEVDSLKIEYPYLKLEMPIFPNFTMDSSEIQKRYENAFKKCWENAISNDLDVAYDRLKKDPIVQKKSEDPNDKETYEERFKQKIETLKRKDMIIQILNDMWNKLPWSGYWKKYEKAKRDRQFREESAWVNEECKKEVVALKNWNEELAKRCPVQFKDEEEKYKVRKVRSIKAPSPRIIEPLPPFKDVEEKCKVRKVHSIKAPSPRITEPLSPFNKCHFVLSCFCFGIGGLVYLIACLYQYYHRYDQYHFFRKKLEQQEMSPLDNHLICRV